MQANTNSITKQLIEAGLIDQVVAMPFKAPGEYIFASERNKHLEAKKDEAGAALKISTNNLKKVTKTKASTPEAIAEAQQHVDNAQAMVDMLETLTDYVSDSKFIRQCVSMAHNGAMGAILAEEGKELPAFDHATGESIGAPTDEELENDPTACHKPSDRPLDAQRPISMSKETGLYNDAVVWSIASHTANVEGNGWLMHMDKREIITNSDGQRVSVRTSDEVILPLGQHIVKELLTVKNESWEATLLACRQLGYDETFITPHVQVNEAMEAFYDWLEEVPPNTKGMTTTRRERIVAEVGDRKWKALLKACATGVRKDIEKAQRDWVLISYSPVAKRQIAAIINSSAYQTLLIERENAELANQADLQKLAMERQQQEIIRTQLQMGQMSLQLQQLELQKTTAAMQAQMQTMIVSLAAALPVQPAASVTADTVVLPPVGIKPSVALTQGMRPVGIRNSH